MQSRVNFFQINKQLITKKLAESKTPKEELAKAKKKQKYLMKNNSYYFKIKTTKIKIQ